MAKLKFKPGYSDLGAFQLLKHIIAEGGLIVDANDDDVVTDVVAEATAAAGVTVDGVKLKDGGVTNSGGTMIAGFYPTAASNDIAAGTGGAVGVTTYLTTVSTDAGGDAFTLANGTQIGQIKKILLVTDGGGDATITPATNLVGGFNLITLDDAGDSILLIWTGTAWAPLDASTATLGTP